MELAKLLGFGAPTASNDLHHSRTARKAGFGAKAGMVMAQRSHGISNGFRQRRAPTEPDRGPSGDRYVWSRTKRQPWKVRERNRRRNQIARASRKAHHR